MAGSGASAWAPSASRGSATRWLAVWDASIAVPHWKAHVPGVDEILDVDRQYRDEAQRGMLPMIAPRRFNPDHEAWLPVLHTRRGDRDYTALYSNTARAHELGRTHDWVVLYFDGHRGTERQCTVVTAVRGRLRGRRVVRGREEECQRYYWPHPPSREPTG